jgi:hypothetical protein
MDCQNGWNEVIYRWDKCYRTTNKASSTEALAEFLYANPDSVSKTQNRIEGIQRLKQLCVAVKASTN